MVSKEEVEIAKKILKLKDSLCDFSINCSICPLKDSISKKSHNELFGVPEGTSFHVYIEAKRKYIENWLKENDFSQIDFFEDEEEKI